MAKPKSQATNQSKSISTFFPKQSSSEATSGDDDQAIDLTASEPETRSTTIADLTDDNASGGSDDESEEIMMKPAKKTAVPVSKPRKPEPAAHNSTLRIAKSKESPFMSSLPPIHRIPDIFEDIVSRSPEIVEVARKLARPLRVATMCSGTESPLLALEQVSRVLKNEHNVTFPIEHVFSCEIEPFKQAYIERNFHPPILFRDVCELGNDYA